MKKSNIFMFIFYIFLISASLLNMHLSGLYEKDLNPDIESSHNDSAEGPSEITPPPVSNKDENEDQNSENDTQNNTQNTDDEIQDSDGDIQYNGNESQNNENDSHNSENNSQNDENNNQNDVHPPENNTPSTNDEPQNNETVPPSIPPDTEQNTAPLQGTSLFIGDSRTVGLMEYSSIENADFFAYTGMSVYDVGKKVLSVKNVGEYSIDGLLSAKQYNRIYIMLGINEVGYDLNQTVAKYRSFVDSVMHKQPDALIFIQANLHVTKSRSESDSVINNPAINRLNSAIAAFADNKKIFYIDANVIFDDAEGHLSSDKSADTAHPYAKYYSEWGTWIVNATSAILAANQTETVDGEQNAAIETADENQAAKNHSIANDILNNETLKNGLDIVDF